MENGRIGNFFDSLQHRKYKFNGLQAFISLVIIVVLVMSLTATTVNYKMKTKKLTVENASYAQLLESNPDGKNAATPGTPDNASIDRDGNVNTDFAGDTVTVKPADSATPTTPTEPATPKTKTGAYICVTDYLNVRDSASEAGDIIGGIEEGDEVEILAISPGGNWGKIDYDGEEGWVCIVTSGGSVLLESVSD